LIEKLNKKNFFLDIPQDRLIDSKSCNQIGNMDEKTNQIWVEEILDQYHTETKEDEDKEEEKEKSKKTSANTYNLIHSLMIQFLKKAKASTTCVHCGCKNPKFRSSLKSTLFVSGLSRVVLDSNRRKHIHLKFGETHLSTIDVDQLERRRLEMLTGQSNESDEEDDEDDEEEIGGNEMFVNVNEAKAQVMLLLLHHFEFINIMFSHLIESIQSNPGSSRNSNSTSSSLSKHPIFSVFFKSFILVSPTRFRPSQMLGDLKTEHPHNILYGNIIKCNNKLETILKSFYKSSKMTENDSEGQDEMEESDSENEQKEEESKEKDEKDSPTQLFLIKYWTNLQLAVNALIDGSDDGGTAGVKKIIERKQGLFRLNMMGKRVNFSCRFLLQIL